MKTDARITHVIAVTIFATFITFAGLWALPPLDRDETRFAQATVQMLETGDFINIRFQDSERNKKPAGIYWLQAASVSVFSTADSREIWAYRIPSMLGAVLAAIFTYLAGVRLFDPRTALLGAALLASSPVLAGEATIAKTDAMLLASITLAQLAFIEVYAHANSNSRERGWLWSIVFWLALSVGVLLKGPIAPMIVGLTGAALLFRRPKVHWLSHLRPIAGLLILFLMIIPWAIAIGLATEWRFFSDSFGADMLAKVGTPQEGHGAPPGYYLLLIPVLLWPVTAMLPGAITFAWRKRRDWNIFFLLSWIIPSWLVFELSATKLPHYVLPLYPAIALLAAHTAVSCVKIPKWATHAGAIFYLGLGLVFGGVVAILPLLYGADSFAPVALAAGVVISGASAVAAALFWRGRNVAGGFTAAVVSASLAWALLAGVLPRLYDLQISPRISEALEAAGRHPLRNNVGPAVLAGYYEPSVVFMLGTKTILTDGAGAARSLSEDASRAAIIESKMKPEFDAELSDIGISVRALAVINGFNYSNGDTVSLTVYTVDSSSP